MLPGRFLLGLGSGENLNEHILADRWPPPDVRHEMLEEAVEIIRRLWEGGSKDFHGQYYTVEDARIYSLPDPAPPIMLAASGPKSAEMAGRLGDGLITFMTDRAIVEAFDAGGGKGKPRYAELTVCWAESEAEARRTAYDWWPIAGLQGAFLTELARPAYFEQAARLINEDDVAREVVCGPDPQRHIAGIQQYLDAGFDHVWVHQVGPDQDGFFRFYEREVLPAFQDKQERLGRAA
jgi:G6PDH family F420-dependent oxidoreductase